MSCSSNWGGRSVAAYRIRLRRNRSAAKARDRKAWELEGEFAYLNFPEEILGKAGEAN